ncbi:MAG: class II aldolase/adducin family protein [Desulfohalobiaceae bacterium]
MPEGLRIMARAGSGSREPGSQKVILESGFESVLQGLCPGREYLLLTWQEQAGQEQEFCPGANPIGLHRARLLHLQGQRAAFFQLQLPEQTRILEIRPVPEPREYWGQDVPTEAAFQLREAAHRAWNKGLLSGFNGNISLRLEDRVVITCSGAAKAFIQPGDLVCLDLATGRALGQGPASSEAGLHLRLYQEQPEAGAVLHTHPPALLSLELRKERLLDLELFEAKAYQELLCRVPREKPGSSRLAELVSSAARDFQAVFMAGHGLVCWAGSLQQAVGLSEELESLARIQLAGVYQPAS